MIQNRREDIPLSLENDDKAEECLRRRCLAAVTSSWSTVGYVVKRTPARGAYILQFDFKVGFF